MTGPVLVANIGIVLRPLVDVLDHQRNRRAGGYLPAGAVILEHAGQDLHLVRFPALRGEAVLARLALVEEALDIGLGQFQAGRAAVDHAPERHPVALAERGDAEHVAE